MISSQVKFESNTCEIELIGRTSFEVYFDLVINYCKDFNLKIEDK